MRPFLTRTTTPRLTLAFVAVLALALGVALGTGTAQGRIDPGTQSSTLAVLSTVVNTITTGGGTVFVNAPTDMTIASFGINAKRPASFPNGEAVGRVNYDKHMPGATGRHINAPVVLMSAESNPLPPNNTGGRAALAADCTATECPSGFTFVLVYVEDNADSGAGVDVFKVFYCSGSPQLPGPSFTGTSAPSFCSNTVEGGTLRSGNIQIRPSSSSTSSPAVALGARAPIRR